MVDHLKTFSIFPSPHFLAARLSEKLSQCFPLFTVYSFVYDMLHIDTFLLIIHIEHTFSSCNICDNLLLLSPRIAGH